MVIKEELFLEIFILETTGWTVNFKPHAALIAKCIEIKRSKVACKA